MICQAEIRLLALFCTALACPAQTVQGMIAGHVIDSVTGAPVVNARITVSNLSINLTQSAPTNSSGDYTATALPPGTYHVRVSADRYQPQEAYSLELPVSGVIDLNFQLRPLSDVWESGRYRSVLLPNSESVLTFFGPDVDASLSEVPRDSAGTTVALEASVSQVVDPIVLNALPLSGRDVYTLLVTQPAVTADTTTSRGLGLAINGQRPTASDFLLDGFENNNYLLTGPQTMVAPEAVQEYRISTSAFSAEYGRTAGYLANAVTRAGGNQWHGLAYVYIKNDALDANDFQNNTKGLGRPPLKEYEPGYQTGGYLRKNSLYVSSAFDALISHGSGDPVSLTLPTTEFVSAFTNPGSIARTLLQKYPSGVRRSNTDLSVSATTQPPVTVDHYLALERLDHIAGDGAHRQMLRVAYAKLDRPDFIWSPYKEFISGLGEPSLNLALSATDVLSPTINLETKVGLSTDDLFWNRAHPEIPTLISSEDGTSLPGSPAFYAFRSRSDNIELLENVSWVWGRHLFKAGGGLLLRRLSGYLTAGAGGEYTFNSLIEFGLDKPESLTVSLARQALPRLSLPSFDRSYRYEQFDFFAQDTFRVTTRLALNYGIRYENFGAPVNTAAEKDATVILGVGSDFAERLATSSVAFPAPGNQQLYKADNKDWAGRFGFSYSPRSVGDTVLHGAFGIFYDRPFDSLWQTTSNNNFILPTLSTGPGAVNYLSPMSQILPSLAGQLVVSDFPYPTMFRPDLKSPYVESYFLGVQQRLSTNLTLDVNGLGALGRRLITTDEVNRPYGVHNANLPLIEYRANQGSSDYYALTALLNARFSRGQLQVAYTWSHSIDNQSDPLTGEFFDLGFAGINPTRSATTMAAFTRQFDSSGDRGSSDFDQRHNFVFYSTWNLPAPSGRRWAVVLLQDWKVSQLAAFRTGEPYTVIAGSSVEFVDNRANLVNEPAAANANVPGGKLLLNGSAFRVPAPGQVGNLGRNSLYGPGLYNADVSLSRSVRVAALGESGRLVLRADAFNVLNHANLNNPNSVLGSQGFGVASYGRQGFDTGFPALTPLNERGRELQLMLRVEF